MADKKRKKEECLDLMLDDKKLMTNRDQMQSYILTMAKYDFTVYEKRILYRIVELAQSYTKLDFKDKSNFTRVEHDLWGITEITLPLSCFLTGDKDKNHLHVRNALKSLSKKDIEFLDKDGERFHWQSLTIIAWPEIQKDMYSTTVKFRIHPKIWDCILDFSKGFTEYELNVALSLKSTYSMRMYELISKQKKPITRKLQDLKEMFKVEGKYDRIVDFQKRILDTAKKELDGCSPYTFTYKPYKNGKTIEGFTFYPVRQPQFRDKELAKNDAYANPNLRFYARDTIEHYLQFSLLIPGEYIKRSKKIINEAEAYIPNLLEVLERLGKSSLGKNNPPAYVLGALKKIVEEIKASKAEQPVQDPQTSLVFDEASDDFNRSFYHTGNGAERIREKYFPQKPEDTQNIIQAVLNSFSENN